MTTRPGPTEQLSRRKSSSYVRGVCVFVGYERSLYEVLVGRRCVSRPLQREYRSLVLCYEYIVEFLSAAAAARRGPFVTRALT